MANNWEQVFGTRVKDLRRLHGWTQDDLATRLTDAGYPMHQTTVTKMESGTRPTSVGEVGALAAIFGVSIADLFGASSEAIPDLRLKALKTRALIVSADLERAYGEMEALSDRINLAQNEIRECVDEVLTMAREFPEMAPKIRELFEIYPKIGSLAQDTEKVVLVEGQPVGGKLIKKTNTPRRGRDGAKTKSS